MPDKEEVGMLRRAVDNTILRLGDMLPGTTGAAHDELHNRMIRCTAIRNILDGASIYLDDMITEEVVTIYLNDNTQEG